MRYFKTVATLQEVERYERVYDAEWRAKYPLAVGDTTRVFGEDEFGGCGNLDSFENPMVIVMASKDDYIAAQGLTGQMTDEEFYDEIKSFGREEWEEPTAEQLDLTGVLVGYNSGLLKEKGK